MEITKSLTIIISVILVLTLINLISTFNLYGKIDAMTGKTVAEPEVQFVPVDNGPQQPSRVQASVDDDPVKGSENAPVTIIEFSDFQCPYCGSFYAQTLSLIEEKYIRTGKVKFTYRDFPLSFHPNAQKAAEASECADEQGKFWEYHNKIFQNQNVLDEASLKQYAKDLGLNIKKFDDCLDSGKMASEVQKDFSDGLKYGVSGTPAFFINGISLTGAQPFASFQQIIEQELGN